MFTGIKESITSFGLQSGDSLEETRASVYSIWETLDNRAQLITMTDLDGGSVNNLLVNLAYKPNVHLVTGMNVPLLLELVLENGINVSKIQRAIQVARESIFLVLLETRSQKI